MRICVLSPARWDAFQVSKQLVTRALAEMGHDILYVDPPISPLSLIRHPDRLNDFRRPASRHALPNLQVWTPRVVPGQNARLGQRVNGALLRRGILRRLGPPELVITFAMESRAVFAQLPGRHVYYCVDSLEDSPGTNQAAFQAYEEELLRAADVAVACSLPLADQLAERGAAPVYLPHGCDIDTTAPARTDLPPELEGLPRPLVGYVGSINFRIDADLLEAARRAIPGGTLVLVGSWWSSSGPKLDRRTRDLLAQPGVVTVGHRELDVLPWYLGALDVGLAPYADMAFNRKSFPIKIPQYLAMGVPVVSTPNGATDEYGDLVYTAQGASAFEAAVRAALAEDSDERRAARRTRANRPWKTVAAELLVACGFCTR